jgi:SPW repeat
MSNWGYMTWMSLILGIWLIVSPWVLRFSGDQTATLDVVIVGLIMGLAGLYVGYFAKRPGLHP